MEETNEKIVKLEGTQQIELPRLDLTKYVGKKEPIVAVTEHEGNFGYYIKVQTDVLETVNLADKIIDLRASKVFGLQTDAEGKIGWGKDTKLGVFLKKMGVTHYDDLITKEVVVQTQTSKEGVDFLTFN